MGPPTHPFSGLRPGPQSISGKMMKSALVSFAREAGFASVGVCRPNGFDALPTRLRAFLDAGYHGQMGWMADRFAWRSDPMALWPDARSIVMLAENYAPGHDPMALLEQPHKGVISVYAQGRDYHDVVKKRLKRVGRWMLEQVPEAQIKVFVDTAPVMEKPLAQAAGLGWQGKHTNLLSRDLGNWFFLGAIFTTIELEPDKAEVSHCGTCSACLDICPTQAFPRPYKLDARRCISYLTIEHKGPVARELRSKLGNRIYGCDDCLAVCPWNKFAKEGHDTRLAARQNLVSPDLIELAQLDDAGFRAMFSGSPIKRIGRDRFVRNVAYALGNSKLAAARPILAELVNDPDEAVADAAQWALEEIG